MILNDDRGTAASAELCRSYLCHPPGSTRNNAGWVNERDRLIPRKYNVPPTNWWYRKDIPSRDVFPVLMRNNKEVEVADRMGLTFSRSAVLMPAPTSRRVRFGDFELDLTTGELCSTETANGNNVLLREQVFQVLRMLLEREGKIVTDARKSRTGCGRMIRSWISTTASTRPSRPCGGLWGIPPTIRGTLRPWHGEAIASLSRLSGWSQHREAIGANPPVRKRNLNQAALSERRFLTTACSMSSVEAGWEWSSRRRTSNWVGR